MRQRQEVQAVPRQDLVMGAAARVHFLHGVRRSPHDAV
ncbi:hypothetical protein PWR63_13940 [Paraburkholderia sp. A2WS-5]